MIRSTPAGMPPARGTKTLAWFMDNDILKNGGGENGENGQGRRGSSSDESKTATSSGVNFYTQQGQQQQKKYKKFRKTLSGHGAARKEGFTSSQAMSESSEDGAPPPPVTSGGATSSGAPTAASGAEEYWFYDVATDGYYYEQNGAKGWRRRQPNAAVHKGGKDQEVAHMSVNGPGKYNQLLAAQAAAAQAAFLQHAFQLQQSQMIPQTPPPSGASGAPQMNNPTMRYYDPSSDGFFYEMASVDGWKRRQPNKPVSASVPAGITRPYSQRHQAPESMPRHPQQPTSSYGAALARGQFPRNTVKQPDSEVLSTTPTTTTTSESARGDSTASSICGDSVTTTTFAELFNSADPMFNPIQRPSALKLEQKAVSPTSTMENAPMNSTAALFDAMLADLNGGEKKTPINFNTYTMPPPPQSSQSPMKESWNSFRSCSLFSPIKPSKRVQNPLLVGSQNQQPMGVATPMIDDMVDDDTMKMLMRDLDKLWANTPVSTLNQA
ncbi:hypothetical protein GCK72_021337 [Caenorhabditis remanei]|uniref:Uncharacterized protein n=1 Tax=Caenorhabditis remanei TaxID=31234 RepID=A0A6A5GJA2_CAERE|nr:hypothetical protein GCK72_021337 [Caenorhabditis remanei]KAF1754773.1 hypothetical protein GCK72_021337 [Caenorhabditis remanei]